MGGMGWEMIGDLFNVERGLKGYFLKK